MQHLSVWMTSRLGWLHNQSPRRRQPVGFPCLGKGQEQAGWGKAGPRETHFGGPAQLTTTPFLERSSLHGSFGSLYCFCWPGSPLLAEELPGCLLQVALMELSNTVSCPAPSPSEARVIQAEPMRVLPTDLAASVPSLWRRTYKDAGELSCQSHFPMTWRWLAGGRREENDIHNAEKKQGLEEQSGQGAEFW